MIRASDLINLDVSKLHSEQHRVSHLISDFSKQSVAEQDLLRSDLMKIIADREMRPSKRSQAAFTLGLLSSRPEQSKPMQFVSPLSSIIDLEFMYCSENTNLVYPRSTVRIQRLPTERAVFLQGIVFAIIAIDREVGAEVVNKLLLICDDPNLSGWLERVAKKKDAEWHGHDG